ncbi:MAG TPA: hypothetical protein VK066_01645 [Chloroflexota bacterium]|nr:hypothetical protein [Chloroflexota bacterium]
MAAEIKLHAGPAFIRFQLDWPYDEIPGYLPTAVFVDTGVFRGEFTTSTWVTEWQALRTILADLDQRVGQGAEAHMEFADAARIGLTFQLERLGHVMLEVDIRLVERDAELRFRLLADQTYLSLWTRAINESLAQLPEG